VATLLINSKNYIDAKVYVDQLLEISPTSPAAYQLLFAILVATKDYGLVLRKVFEFDKHLDEDSLADMILEVIRDALRNNKPLEPILERIPKSIEKHPLVMTGKIEGWLDNEEHIKAEAALRKLIPNTWSKALILLYADLSNPSINELSNRIDKWLDNRPRDANLWLTASRLAQRDGLWSKAKQCLERSIELSHSASKYTELALVLSELGEKEEALTALKSARELDK
jgi:HemY protein